MVAGRWSDILDEWMSITSISFRRQGASKDNFIYVVDWYFNWDVCHQNFNTNIEFMALMAFAILSGAIHLIGRTLFGDADVNLKRFYLSILQCI